MKHKIAVRYSLKLLQEEIESKIKVIFIGYCVRNSNSPLGLTALTGSRCRLEGVLIVEHEKSQLFRSCYPDIFPDTPGNPENPGKCQDISAYQGGIKFD
jgi:hypothetical protein